MRDKVEEVRDYWDSHLNLTQFLDGDHASLSSEELYQRLGASLDRYEYKKPLLEEFAKSRKGQRLLEVGCGLGLELGFLAQCGLRVTGVDLAPRAVALCNEHLHRLGTEGTALVQNAESLKFADESFDAVYSSGVLQHTPNIQQAIDEIWRVLRPGGAILIILYHRHSWFSLLHRLSGVNVEFDSEDAPIVNAYTRSELRSLFGRFVRLNIETEYHTPLPSRRPGILPLVYNSMFVPAARAVPLRVRRRFGWHLVLTAFKSTT